MKVKELIEILKEYKEDAEIYIDTTNFPETYILDQPLKRIETKLNMCDEIETKLNMCDELVIKLY